MVTWTTRQARALAPLVLGEYGATCWLCNRPIDLALPRTDKEGLTIDHVTPRALGGGNELSNLRPAHSICNKRRGTRRAGVIRKLTIGAAWPKHQINKEIS